MAKTVRFLAQFNKSGCDRKSHKLSTKFKMGFLVFAQMKLNWLLKRSRESLLAERTMAPNETIAESLANRPSFIFIKSEIYFYFGKTDAIVFLTKSFASDVTFGVVELSRGLISSTGWMMIKATPAKSERERSEQRKANFNRRMPWKKRISSRSQVVFKFHNTKKINHSPWTKPFKFEFSQSGRRKLNVFQNYKQN